MTKLRRCLITVVCLAAANPVFAQFAGLDPTIRSGATDRIGPHSYVILDRNAQFVPNVGFVVGDEATLVIDTGMGVRNGRIVLDEARRLAPDNRLIVAATHYHPEHDLGAEAFPDDALLVRWSGQQAEIDATGAATIDRFRSFSPVVADLLDGVRYRHPDILFDSEILLDLGGVHVRIFGVGPNHTRGDTVFLAEEDHVLYAGDVVMPVFPSASAQDGSIDRWIANMDRFAALDPEIIVPAHGRLLDTDSIPLYRSYMLAVQDAARTLARSGTPGQDAIAASADAIAARFPSLVPDSGSPAGRITAALNAALREASSP